MSTLVRHLVHSQAPPPRPWVRAALLVIVVLAAVAQLDTASTAAGAQLIH
jgi:hypothetical protein